MDTFFTGMAPDKALELAAVSRRAFDLREQRKQLLDGTGFDDADALLAAVREGGAGADAGYDAWLALALLQEQHDALRAWIDGRCRDAGGGGAEPGTSPLAELLEAPLPEPFASRLTLHPDAVSFAGDGMAMTARIVSATEWALQWSVGDRGWRLDTAPRGEDAIATRARLRRPDGSSAADPWRFDRIVDRGGVLPHFLAMLAASPEP